VTEREIQLTFITAVYNGDDYIKSTIESVLHFAKDIDFEYIVINDGSTDSTTDILASFGDKIKVIHQQNRGESASVNVGIENAQGTCSAVISADDPILTSRLFENVFDNFDSEPELAAIYPDWQMIDEVGNIIKIIYVPDYSDELLIGRCRTLPGPGVIFRTSFAQQIGGRRSKWTYVGDYDFWLRLSRVGEIRHRPEVLAQWRYHANSTSVTKRGLKMANERIAVIEDFLANNSVENSLSRRALGTSYYMAARLVFFSNEVPGRKYLLKAFKYRRGWVEEAQLQVIAYILLLPISRWLLNPLLSRSKKYRTLI
jgi:glycosyltransferase involved in cell wall biosynthesis